MTDDRGTRFPRSGVWPEAEVFEGLSSPLVGGEGGNFSALPLEDRMENVERRLDEFLHRIRDGEDRVTEQKARLSRMERAASLDEDRAGHIMHTLGRIEALLCGGFLRRMDMAETDCGGVGIPSESAAASLVKEGQELERRVRILERRVRVLEERGTDDGK